MDIVHHRLRRGLAVRPRRRRRSGTPWSPVGPACTSSHRDGAALGTGPDPVGADAALDAEGALGRVRANRLDRSQQLALVAAGEAWADAGPRRVDRATAARRRRRDRDRREWRRCSTRTTCSGHRRAPGVAAHRADAHGQRGRGADQHRVRRPGRRLHDGVGVRVRRRGDRHRRATHRHRGGRRRHRRRDRGGGHPGDDGLVRPVPGPREARRRRPRPRCRGRSTPTAAGSCSARAPGIVVLERADARRRPRAQRSHGTLAGWGITSDAFHITAPLGGRQRAGAGDDGRDPDGRAHRDGRRPRQRARDRAPRSATSARRPPSLVRWARGAVVTAPKSAIGHMFGAAGAVEAILTVRALETGIVPPTLNLEHLDPAIDLDVVSGAARTAPVRAALNNSFGFGGQNASLALLAVSGPASRLAGLLGLASSARRELLQAGDAEQVELRRSPRTRARPCRRRSAGRRPARVSTSQSISIGPTGVRARSCGSPGARRPGRVPAARELGGLARAAARPGRARARSRRVAADAPRAGRRRGRSENSSGVLVVELDAVVPVR